MKSVYKVFAYIVALGVIVQAMAMVFAVAGLGKWVEEGGVFDQAVMESEESPFPEVIGFAIHGIGGTMVIPIIALIFLIVSFFTKAPGAILWAGIVLLLVALQVTLGLLGHGIPALGALHGLNALLLFSAAVYAGRRVRTITETDERTPTATPELV